MDTNATSPLNLDEDNAWRALTYVANHLVKTLADDLAADSPLSLSQYVALVHLSEATDAQLRIGDLAQAVGLSPSRMSRVIDQMASDGLVSKKVLDDDARCTYAVMTDKGLRALQAAYPLQLRNVRRRVFDHLSVDEIQVLGRALGKVCTGLDQRLPIR